MVVLNQDATTYKGGLHSLENFVKVERADDFGLLGVSPKDF